MAVQIVPTRQDLAQRHFEQDRSEILRELEHLRLFYRPLFDAIPTFCRMARQGRVVFTPPVSYPEDLRVLGILAKYPCVDFYGASCDYRVNLAWLRVKMVRRTFHSDRYPHPEMHCTPIEIWLYKCLFLEDQERVIRQTPLSWENPGLQLLITLLEEEKENHPS